MCGTMEGFINTRWFKRQESASEEVNWTLSSFSRYCMFKANTAEERCASPLSSGLIH